MTDSIAADVMEIIAKNLPEGHREVALTDRLSDLGIDSFTAVEIIFAVEEKFNIQVPFNANDKNASFETVAQIVDAIRNELTAKS
jgi:acyl carrier protein